MQQLQKCPDHVESIATVSVPAAPPTVLPKTSQACQKPDVAASRAPDEDAGALIDGCSIGMSEEEFSSPSYSALPRRAVLYRYVASPPSDSTDPRIQPCRLPQK